MLRWLKKNIDNDTKIPDRNNNKLNNCQGKLQERPGIFYNNLQAYFSQQVLVLSMYGNVVF